ncbi:MAG: metallophosphoesterase [Planctomycetales bacterium]|nr:metallophosphoesterase [Planctomycetales bacterium]
MYSTAAHIPRRCGWLTDIHLNFVNLSARDALWQKIASAQLDSLLITGDISEADDICYELTRLRSEFPGQIFFVLGNHDFYHGSIDLVRERVEWTCKTQPRLHYLTGNAPMPMAGGWSLCGDDGWGDARLGDFFCSPIRMNDFRLINDFAHLDSHSLYRKLKRLGTESAIRLSQQLRVAAQQSNHILVLTHLPPFKESCWYEGGHGNDDWLPFFACHAVGLTLKRFCRSNPSHEVIVLCGHTHHRGVSRILPNLLTWTGQADYGQPQLEAILNMEDFVHPNASWGYP